MVAINISSNCGGPTGLGLWAESDPNTRRQIANANWARGMVASDVDYDSMVAPVFYWPPGHPCSQSNDIIGTGMLPSIAPDYAEQAAAGQVAAFTPGDSGIGIFPNPLKQINIDWKLIGLLVLIFAGGAYALKRHGRHR